jgi:hypothetical protein
MKLSLLAFLIAWLPAAAALADVQADKAKAVALFDDGIKNMKAGNYERACKDLAASNALLPDSGTRGSLARCYTKLGKLTSAWLLWRELADTAPNPELRADARTQAAKLEARLSKYVIKVSRATTGLAVKLDGRQIDTSIDVPTPIDAGKYRLEASAPGHTPWQTDVIVVEGKTATFEVPVLVAVAKPKVPKEEKPVVTTKPAGRGRKIAAITISVLGAGGLVVGGVFGAKARTLNDEAKELCGGNIDQCPAGQIDASQAKVDDARKAATISTIAFAAGGALVVTGIILIVTAPKAEKRAVTIAPLIGDGGTGIALGGRF